MATSEAVLIRSCTQANDTLTGKPKNDPIKLKS